MEELRELCIELDRYWYYGRQDAVAEQMQKIRKHLSKTAAKPSLVITGDVTVAKQSG